MNFKQATSVLALGLPVLLGACTANNTNVVQEGQLQGRPQVVDDQRLISNPGLARQVALTGVIESETPGGFRKVQAELFNETNSFKTVRYQFSWFDQDNFAVESPVNAWTTVGIQPQAFARITGVAPTANAVDFRLNLRPAQ